VYRLLEAEDRELRCATYIGVLDCPCADQASPSVYMQAQKGDVEYIPSVTFRRTGKGMYRS
jgi:hypothetical protein